MHLRWLRIGWYVLSVHPFAFQQNCFETSGEVQDSDDSFEPKSIKGSVVLAAGISERGPSTAALI